MTSFLRWASFRDEKYRPAWNRLVEARQDVASDVQTQIGMTSREILNLQNTHWNRLLTGANDADVFGRNVKTIPFPTRGESEGIRDAYKKKVENYKYATVSLSALLARLLWAYPYRLKADRVRVCLQWLELYINGQPMASTPYHNISTDKGAIEARLFGSTKPLLRDNLDFQDFLGNESYHLLFVRVEYGDHQNVMVVHRSSNGSLLACLFEPHGTNYGENADACFSGRSAVLRALRPHLPQTCKITFATDCDSYGLGMQYMIEDDPGLCIYFSMYYCILCMLNPHLTPILARKMTHNVTQDMLKDRVTRVLSLAMRFANVSKKEMVAKTQYRPRHLEFVAYMFEPEGKEDGGDAFPDNVYFNNEIRQGSRPPSLPPPSFSESVWKLGPAKTTPMGSPCDSKISTRP
jgi:hypothetical protein